MATPVHTLPESAAGAAASAVRDSPHDADEVVTAVLQDMEKDFEDAAQQQAAAPVQRRPASAIAAVAPQLSHSHSNTGSRSLLELNMEHLKLAGVVAVLGAIAFHPNLTQMLYEKIPRLSVLETYDMFVRALLLAAAFYVLLTFYEQK